MIQIGMLLLLLSLAIFAEAATVTVPGTATVIGVPPGCTLSGDATKGYTIGGCDAGGGPTLPPDPPAGAISCTGVAGKTIVLTMNWANPGRVDTRAAGMGPKDAVVVQFTTGGTASPANNLPRISAGEYGSTPSTRLAVLSPKPCDWSAQPMLGASSSGTSVTVPFTVNNPVNYGFYPILDLNTTYYYNIKNDANPSCAASGVCDLAVDLSKPSGFLVAPSKAQQAAIAKQNKADKARAKAALAAAKKQAK